MYDHDSDMSAGGTGITRDERNAFGRMRYPGGVAMERGDVVDYRGDEAQIIGWDLQHGQVLAVRGGKTLYAEPEELGFISRKRRLK